jgi:hypothetical protein
VSEPALPGCPVLADPDGNPHGRYGRRRANGQETARIGVQAVRLPAGEGGTAARCLLPAASRGGARELVLQPGPAPARRRSAAPDPLRRVHQPRGCRAGTESPAGDRRARADRGGLAGDLADHPDPGPGQDAARLHRPRAAPPGPAPGPGAPGRARRRPPGPGIHRPAAAGRGHRRDRAPGPGDTAVRPEHRRPGKAHRRQPGPLPAAAARTAPPRGGLDAAAGQGMEAHRPAPGGGGVDPGADCAVPGIHQ